MKNKHENLKRVIVDFKKLTPDILAMLVAKFPDGYDDDDIISFRNAKNELIEAVEVRTDDTIYLVKIGVKLVKAMEEHEDEDENLQDDDSTNDTVDIDALN